MRRTIVRFFTIADYEEEEIWLREQHRNGRKLVRVIPPCFYVFEDCEPQEVVYRLDYKNSRQTEEYMQMVRDFGWEYFTQCVGWLYFRKPADPAGSVGGSLHGLGGAGFIRILQYHKIVIRIHEGML